MGRLTVTKRKTRKYFNLSMALGLGLGLAFLLLPKTRASNGVGVLQRAPAATLTRGPYLQSVTTNSVIVVWETTGPATSQVDYGPTAGYGSTVSDPTSVTHHALTLTGLSPYSIYHYQISSDGGPLGGDNAFRSAAAPAQTAFTFVTYGDTQANDAPHQSVVNRIIALAPNFLLHTGDHVDNGNISSQWTNFFDIEQDLLRQTPLSSSPGNHALDSPLYFDAFHHPGNERWYSFDYGDAHFISLQIDGYVSYMPGSEQYTWLQNDLANTDRLWKIVFFHIPPYTSGAHGHDSEVYAVQAALPPLFAQYDVDIVFSGHDHDYERSVVSDVVYIVNGGGGRDVT